MIVNTHYSYCGGGGVPGERGTIVVTAPTGSTVTATLGTTTLRASEISGTWTFNVREFGVWAINASKGGESASTTVNVTEDTTYEVSLAYTPTITINGNGATRGVVYARVYVNGVAYYSNLPASVTVQNGNEITLQVRGGAGVSGIIKVNGETVVTNQTVNLASGQYVLAVRANTTVALSTPGSGNRLYGLIEVTY